MRIVAANVKDAQPLETVLTAKATREQFQKLWPVMEPPSELSSPGPTRVVNVELSSGQRATLVFHETLNFVEILASVEAGVEVGLADLLVDIAVSPTAITWTHPDIDQRAISALHDSAARDVSNAGEVVIPLFLSPLAHPTQTDARTRARRAAILLAPLGREDRATAIYEKYFPRLVRFVRAYRLSEQDAEDLAQEAFIRFYRSMSAYRGDAEWPLLETVARSVLFNKMRAQASSRRRSATIDIDDVKNSAEVSFEPNYVESNDAVLRRKRLHDAIAALSAGQRQCIQLWLDGFAYDEIARALHLTSDIVKTRLREAKKHLRDHLAKEGAYSSQECNTKAGGGESDGGLTSR